MTFKLFSVVALAALSTIVTAELPSDVKDCLNQCTVEDNSNSCGAECIGTTLEVMEKFEKCSNNCVAESTQERDAALVCVQGCVSDFDKESKYSYQDIVTGMVEIATDALVTNNGSSPLDKNDVESDTVQSSKTVSKTATESATKSTTKSSSTTSTNANDDDDDDTADSDNGASTTASFMGSVGLSVAVIAYQFS
ncbi:hypothetical protein IWQ62_000851 [Dispira parvispora]|uniref:Uncharacterized protein n=1 Tax=Dispira parvispora TaxID=1520584 RepID=A0A9W8B0E9_9FUNG|nr:hypothetical protein IWQ62_000851 [Dispira parvispora]